jgi:hypothetical protein
VFSDQSHSPDLTPVVNAAHSAAVKVSMPPVTWSPHGLRTAGRSATSTQASECHLESVDNTSSPGKRRAT